MYPELLSETAGGAEGLREEEFLTAFNRRVYAFLLSCTAEHGRFESGYLGEVFSDEEIGRITGMQVARTQLTRNDMSVIRDNITVLREEGAKEKQKSTDLSADDLKNLIRSRRGE